MQPSDIFDDSDALASELLAVNRPGFRRGSVV